MTGTQDHSPSNRAGRQHHGINVALGELARKHMIVTYLQASGVCALLFGQASSVQQVLWWASPMSFFNLGAWRAVYTYTLGLYATRISTTDTASAMAFGRLGRIAAPILVGVLLPYLGPGGVLAFNANLLAITAISLAILGVETKGSPRSNFPVISNKRYGVQSQGLNNWTPVGATSSTFRVIRFSAPREPELANRCAALQSFPPLHLVARGCY